MTRSILLTKDTDETIRKNAEKSGRAFIVPFKPNTYVWIIVNHKPVRTLCMDVGLHSIQLNGRWYDWEEIENLGGIFESEFDALRSM
ncbi:hypothetical protein SAMN02910400_00749 [Lachnospiraceae bacterium C10]|jgi:hypothetical protein|nr:hypothetical protein [Lachnospiraceae bacterium]SCW43019.1 hypothetical protein SAMN02910400_00749 [Lachnospiraceae bacterium C10]SDW93523.1 hypothetical protein SAMN05216391_1254 [Lachnospiraceae bacterium KHCPX20]